MRSIYDAPNLELLFNIHVFIYIHIHIDLAT